MRCSLTNKLADLTFLYPFPYTLHRNFSFHFGSLSTRETNFVLLAMMIAAPFDCAEIPLLVFFTVFPFTSFLIPPRQLGKALIMRQINISKKKMMAFGFFVFLVTYMFLCLQHKVIVDEILQIHCRLASLSTCASC